MIWECNGAKYTTRAKAVGTLCCLEPVRMKGWIKAILTLTSDPKTVAERYANCEDTPKDRLNFAMGEAERYLKKHRELDILRFDGLMVYRDDAVFKRHTLIDGNEYLINRCGDCPFLVDIYIAGESCNHPDRTRRAVHKDRYPPEYCPLPKVKQKGLTWRIRIW